MNKELLKIGRIEAKDFLVFKEITLNPNDRLNLLIGKNANGKTGFLKAITTALKGTSDKSVIRTGTDKATLMVDIGEYRVTRNIKRTGSNTLVIKNGDGNTKGSPQEWLDNIMGVSFDPVTFMLAEDKLKYILKCFRMTVTPDQLLAAGVEQDVIDELDFKADGLAVLKAARSPYFTQRTDANKEVKAKKIILDDALAKVEGFNPATFFPGAADRIKGEIEELNRKITRATTLEEQKEKNEELRVFLQEKIDTANDHLADCESGEEYERRMEVASTRTKEIDEAIRLLEAEREIIHAQWEIDEKAFRDLAQWKKDLQEAKESLVLLSEVEILDKSGIEAQLERAIKKLTEAEDLAATHGFWLAIEKFTRPEYETAKAKADALQVIIEKLDGDVKNEIMKSGNIPVDALTIEDNKVFIGDRNADNLSTGEQLRAGVRILRALNKNTRLKTFFVDRLESLDDENFAELCDEIQDGDFQYFASRVIHNGEQIPEGAIEIKDGQWVKEAVNE